MIVSNKTYVAHAPGKGRGVFALKDLVIDEVVEVAPMLVVPEEDTDLVYASFLAEYWYEAAPEASYSLIALGHASLYNHEDEPNAEYVIDDEKKTITIFAIRDIKIDEEITISYGFHPLQAQLEDQLDQTRDALHELRNKANKARQTSLGHKAERALELLN